MSSENIARYLVVLLCVFNSFYVGRKKEPIDKQDLTLLRLGMFFTAIADYFLIFTGYYTAGVLFFCVVQFVYGIRYTGIKRLRTEIVVGGIVFILASALFRFNFVLAFGALYAVFLIFSVSGAFQAYDRYPFPNNLLITMGMVLFLLCDICVLSYNALSYAGIEGQFVSTLYLLIWIFYLPSQAFLSSSGRKEIKEEENEESEEI